MRAIVLCCFIAAIYAAPVDEKDATVVKEEFEANPETGAYNFAVETSNGIRVQESGAQKLVGDESGNTAKGSFSYTAPDGSVITLTYVADENGFQPQGAHLPVAPPVPEHVVKLLADLAAAAKQKA